VMRGQRKWEDGGWGGSEIGLMLRRLIACDANGDDWLHAAAAMGAAVARRKGWHFQGLLAAGGINKERFKKGGILKVCRSFFLFFSSYCSTAYGHFAAMA
jgi:hypothetical protein